MNNQLKVKDKVRSSTNEYIIDKLYTYDGQYYPSVRTAATAMNMNVETLSSRIKRSKNANKLMINNKELTIKYFYSKR